VEVGVIGHIAGGVGEDHVGVLLGLVGQGLHIAEGATEDDVAALADQGVGGGGHGVILLGHVVHDGQLGGGVQAQILHGGGDAVVVGVGIARRVVPAVDVDGAHLEVSGGAHLSLGGVGRGGVRLRAGAVLGAGPAA